MTVIGMAKRASGDDGENGNATVRNIGWIGGLLVIAAAHAAIILTARGVHLDVTGNMMFATALLMTALGNFLGKTKPNPYAGVRTAWTRQSRYAWEKSNRLCGRLFVVVGLITLGTLIAGDTVVATSILIGGILGAAALSTAMSYYYWKHDPARTDGD